MCRVGLHDEVEKRGLRELLPRHRREGGDQRCVELGLVQLGRLLVGDLQDVYRLLFGLQR